MLQIVTAIEQDGMDTRTLTMVFEVPDGKFDLVEAVKAAATDYCLTPEGKGTFDFRESRCTCFSADASKEDIAAALEVLLARFYDAYIKNPSGSLKALADQLASISEKCYRYFAPKGGARA